MSEGVIVNARQQGNVVVGVQQPTKVDVTIGINRRGLPGPPGTIIVALPYDQWPPVNPQVDTLYLRLAPA